MGMGGNWSKDAKDKRGLTSSHVLLFAVLLRFSIPAPGLLEDEQRYILGVIESCQAAELRGLRSLKCSKEETAQKILDILGPLEHFRDRPLTLALALEALLQLSTMRP
ncbi:Hypothetical predicted protein [Podarcis lilfordi]|uniref:Uncharacterized protein n=1 Tax=Podarcis lilfordi TaxID=74358 RepID=A0AA35LJ99_9SAUR|nr:Hypothetical predicted protein [Podarcis lilfordi]